ncbi:MAG: ATP-binding protein [Tildeniella nuda ZEHNDER 1965/U140]|jgi:hypothetical protein|nr:ATP-binding protein [Tildeniella nuda ZEHNDER 1965/U140]
MADAPKILSSDDFRVAITDPARFFGRSNLIAVVLRSPFQVRILLGGRRIGKTSTLRALEWNLFESASREPRQAFPVYLSLQVEQPKSLGNFRYLLIARLREAIERWQNVSGTTIREMYRQFLRQVSSGEVTASFLSAINTKLSISDLDQDRQLTHDDFRTALLKTIEELYKWKFEGICFLLDESEYIVQQDWANDAWSYIRGLKDTDTALKPFLGFLLSGYRDLEKYQQQIGSPLLNIADIEWLTVLTDAEAEQLISYRSQEVGVSLGSQIETVMKWTGGHPYLIQEVLSTIFDNFQINKVADLDGLLEHCLSLFQREFSRWWGEDQNTDGFGEIERSIYYALITYREANVEDLAQFTGLGLHLVEKALNVLAGSGVIQWLNEGNCTIGATLFEKWVAQKLFKPLLTVVRPFLEQAGATTNPLGERCLQVMTIQGKLKPYAPLPVLLAIDKPNDRDIVELFQYAVQLVRNRQKQVGVFIYRELPDALFRVRMAEVRLRDHFILIPLSLAEVEKALVGSASRGLIAKYAERYLPGSDLFDDRNAISDTLAFFGRAKLLETLTENLQRNQSIGLFGLRKSGKTSVIRQLEFALRQYPHPVVQIDLQRYGDKLRFGSELFNEILQQLTRLASSSVFIQVNDNKVFSNNQEQPKKPIVTPLKIPLLPCEAPAAELTNEFIRQVSQLVNVLKEVGYRLPIICFLDEIEQILPRSIDSFEKAEEFNAFFRGLRVLSQEQEQLALLVADVHPDCNRINHWTQSDALNNPVYNFFKETFLLPFLPDDTTTMLTDIGQMMGQRFDQEVLAAIHKQSGGHPFLARQLASLLCTKITTEAGESITWSKAQRYLKNPFTYSGVLKEYFRQNIWADLEKRKFISAMTILNVLACNSNLNQGIAWEVLLMKLKHKFSEDQCLDALLWLESVGLISLTEVEDENYYCLQVPLLSRWLQMQLREEEILQWQIN